MTIADTIYQNVQTMPNHLAQEVLDFTEYLKIKWTQPKVTPTQIEPVIRFKTATEPTSLLKLLDQCPLNYRASEDIDRQLQTIRDEWEDSHAIS